MWDTADRSTYILPQRHNNKSKRFFTSLNGGNNRGPNGTTLSTQHLETPSKYINVILQVFN